MKISDNKIQAALNEIEKTQLQLIQQEKMVSLGQLVDNCVLISIIDNGIGIPIQNQQQIFNPFFTTKPIGKGTGLGLSISYQIVVEEHKGKIRCFSNHEQGTEFQIEIPIQVIS